MTSSTAIAPDSDAYYVKLFVENPAWSAPVPNEDESARWAKISGLLKAICAQHPQKNLRILEVGCGRGWLSNLISEFGECEGVEPVSPVVDQARKLFPHLKFTAGTADAILGSPDFQPYDLVVTSEVIEHVPRSGQPDFARKLARLLKPGGHAILTTPRGESFQEWTRLSGDPSQPVEDWLSEFELRQLFTRAQFSVFGHERVLFDADARSYVSGKAAKTSNQLVAIYQVWAFQLSIGSTPDQAVVAEIVLTEFHRACVTAANRALAALPDDPILLTARAKALISLNDFAAARESLAWTVALHANYAPARKLFAEVLRQLGETAAADAQADRATELEAAAQPDAGVKVFSFLNHLREGVLHEGTASQLEVRSATIAGRSASCIYLHPPAKLHFEIPGGAAGRFTCAIAMQPETWDKPTADGCEFFLTVDGREVFRKSINPRQLPTHRCWHEIDIEIPATSGAAHEFTFCTQAVGSPPDFRWALWREPFFRSHAESANKPL